MLWRSPCSRQVTLGVSSLCSQGEMGTASRAVLGAVVGVAALCEWLSPSVASEC